MKTTDTTTQTAAVADQGAHVAPEKATATKVAIGKKGAPKGKHAAKKDAKPATKAANKKASKPAAKPAGKKATKDSVPREFSKKAIVLDLLRRKGGATMTEIAKATDWQNHSIRGFISGNVAKKMGLAVESTRNEAGERTYRITGK